ncbi:MAG: hypothetical protein NTW86_09285 [Candidatus Sumerlaeota bacterium]|nr:hypothetical protein [Candidatus Sumerlaeota bacterium]
MKELKTHHFSMKMRPSVRDLLEEISDREDRKPGDMVEYLIKDFARRNGIEPPAAKGGAKPKK